MGAAHVGVFMKKLTAVLLVALLLVTAVFAQSGSETASASKATKIGFVVINDESDQGYTWNFVNGMEAALAKLKAEGYNIELLYKKNTTESAICKDNNIELAEEGCEIIFNNSYGFEPYMLEAAKEYPKTKFVGMTNCGSQVDDNPNTYNAFAAIYEARYVAGIAAGMKLQQEINEGKIKPEEAVMGYVGAFSFAEVISGMSGFYLGARSVCPSVTMKVYFVGTWGDATLEEAAANALIDAGCKLISQHSDTTSPALAAQKAGIYHVGYNTDMTKVAPNASLLSSRIDWTRYFYTFIKNHIDGKQNASDWTGTYAEGDVAVTALNTAIAAPGTQEAMDKAIAAFHAGTLHVFDLSTFTIGGAQGTNENMYDSFAAVQGNATYGGYFHESETQSAPYFVGNIDGIEWLNAAY
jgi:basic membrane protein A